MHRGYLLRKGFYFNLFFVVSLSIHAQPGLLSVSGDSVGASVNMISIGLKKSQVIQIHQPLKIRSNLEFRNVQISVNGISTVASKIKVHGNTSLYFRRKSFSIRLHNKVPFIEAGDTLYLNKLFAISLSMDKDYIRNAIAFEVLTRNDLTIPFHCFGTIKFNDLSEGIYMIFMPPQDFAMKKCHSHFVVRRNYNSAIKKIYHSGLNGKMIRASRSRFMNIYHLISQHYEGRELYDSLSRYIDFKNYYDWLAFNYLFENGDYTDEVYFYLDPNTGIFKIIPWDFDDIFSETPHEGIVARSGKYPYKLLFSLEEKLDNKIAGDPFLYHKYLNEFQSFLVLLDPESLKGILQKVYEELLPYYQTPDIISQSEYDKYGKTDLKRLQDNLMNINTVIISRREILQKKIEQQLEMESVAH